MILLLIFLGQLLLNFILYPNNNHKKKVDDENATNIPARWGLPDGAYTVGRLPHNAPPKWDTIFREVGEIKESSDVEKGAGPSKGKKKRAKKRPAKEKVETVGVYPFSKPSTAMQRKIKNNYNQLVKANASNELTAEKVKQFANCLVEARDDIDERTNALERKLAVTDTLLLKVDRASCNRVRKQMNKIDREHKMLEEDTFVYNWLQDQLNVSPAYQKMLEIPAYVEKKEQSIFLPESDVPASVEKKEQPIFLLESDIPVSVEKKEQSVFLLESDIPASMEKKEQAIVLLESDDEDFSYMSFEELLEKEKKDSCWCLENGKFKSFPADRWNVI